MPQESFAVVCKSENMKDFRNSSSPDADDLEEKREEC